MVGMRVSFANKFRVGLHLDSSDFLVGFSFCLFNTTSAYMNDEENPFKPTTLNLEARRAGIRLRMVPALVIGGLGVASIAWGLLGFMMVIGLALSKSEPSISRSQQIGLFALMIAVCVLFVGVGLLGTFAGLSVWREKYWRAVWYLVIAFSLIGVVVALDFFRG